MSSSLSTTEAPPDVAHIKPVEPVEKAQTGAQRIVTLDLLRGFVMVIMALDHTRDYFSNAHIDPTDLTKTDAALFLTRLITHFCAPTFILAAGIGAFLYGNKRGCRKDLSWFLFTRGVWLVFLELTVVTGSWSFDFSLHRGFAQVIWAIGLSMIVLAGLIWLPMPAILAFGSLTILGHNLFDGIQPERLGIWGNAWKILHAGGFVKFTEDRGLFVLYPLIPWVGLISVGYVLGVVYLWTPERRRRFLLRLGTALVVAFFLVRGVNIYGDPHRWATQPSPLFTLFSLVNCHKYPPSLCYLLMTLGPACLALALLERARGRVASIFVTFGRVPMFYYLLHIPLIHGLSILFAAVQNVNHSTVRASSYAAENSAPGYPLPVVYVMWLVVVTVLYFPCRWFAGVKARHKDWAWMSYL